MGQTKTLFSYLFVWFALQMDAMMDQSVLHSGLEDNTSDYPTYVGYIGAVIAILFFGSNFVPVKKFETGDGE